jgi:hypothetical protein
MISLWQAAQRLGFAGTGPSGAGSVFSSKKT